MAGIFILKSIPGHDRKSDWRVWRKKTVQEDEIEIETVEAETVMEM